MSKNKSYLPQTEESFNEWQDNFGEKLAPNIAKWEIPPSEADDLTKLRTAYEAAYNVANMGKKTTRTGEQIRAKDTATSAYKSALRQFVNKNLSFNELVTESDKVALRITVRDKSRTLSGTPESMPDLFAEPLNGSRLKVTARQQPHADGRARRGRPDDASCFELAIWLGNSPPADGDPCLDKRRFTRTPCTIKLPAEDAGKLLTIYARWIGHLGQLGPWSMQFDAMVPK